MLHCTSYALAPSAGCQATSGVDANTGFFVLAESRWPLVERPDANGVPLEVRTGSLTLPKLATRPFAHASCGTSWS